MTERGSFGDAAQRYLDGGPPGDLGAEERAAADRLVEGVRAYAARLQPPRSALEERVMAAVATRNPAPRRGALRWLLSPQPVRVRPVWVPVLAAAAALVVWLAPRGPAGTPAPAAVVTPVALTPAAVYPGTVYVHFELKAPRAHSVSVAGTFNGWRVGELMMTRRPGGVWSVTAPLPVGEHRYDFVVDGTHWVPDPTAHVQVDDGFGGLNSVIVVGPRGLVRS